MPVQQALYHHKGERYHHLKRFPGALFDPDGYIEFETQGEYPYFATLTKVTDVVEPSATPSETHLWGTMSARRFTESEYSLLTVSLADQGPPARQVDRCPVLRHRL